MRNFTFSPKGIVLRLPAQRGGNGLMDIIFCPLTTEEMNVLRDMGKFWLTCQTCKPSNVFLGHQARNVKVTDLKSRLHPDWTTREVFDFYREYYFSVDEHELPLKGRQ